MEGLDLGQTSNPSLAWKNGRFKNKWWWWWWHIFKVNSDFINKILDAQFVILFHWQTTRSLKNLDCQSDCMGSQVPLNQSILCFISVIEPTFLMLQSNTINLQQKTFKIEKHLGSKIGYSNYCPSSRSMSGSTCNMYWWNVVQFGNIQTSQTVNHRSQYSKQQSVNSEFNINVQYSG